jgi:hypothetical protein
VGQHRWGAAAHADASGGQLPCGQTQVLSASSRPSREAVRGHAMSGSGMGADRGPSVARQRCCWPGMQSSQQHCGQSSDALRHAVWAAGRSRCSMC